MSLVAYASSEESSSDGEMASEPGVKSDGLFQSLPPPRQEYQAETATYPGTYQHQSVGEQEQHSPGFYGHPGLGFHPHGYYGPASYGSTIPSYTGNQSPVGYGTYGHSNSQGSSNYTSYSTQGLAHANYPPPGFSLPPPPGSPGMNLPPPTRGHGLNLPSPQAGKGVSIPPPPGGHSLNLPHPGQGLNVPPPPGTLGLSMPTSPGSHGLNIPPPQSGSGMNLPPPQQGSSRMTPPPPQQGGSGMNLPPPTQKGGSGMNLPPPTQQGGSGMNLPPPTQQGGSGMNLPPPTQQGGSGMNLPPPTQQGGSGMNLPPPQQGGSGMTLPPPMQSSLGLNLPPPITDPGTNLPPSVGSGLRLPPPHGVQGLNFPPPQLNPTSSVSMEPQLTIPPPKMTGNSVNLPSPAGENMGYPKPKKRSEPVKISVPELHTGGSDSEEDEPSKKKVVPPGSREGFGLSALLPQPKNASGADSKRQLLPYCFTKKASDSSSNTTLPKSVPSSKPKLTSKPEVSHTPSPSAIKAAAKNAALQVTKQITQEENEESDEELQQGNFFSLSETNNVPVVTSENFSYPVPVADEDISPAAEPEGLQNNSADAPLEFKTATGPSPNQPWSSVTGEDYSGQQYNQYPDYGSVSGETYYQDYYSSGYYQEPEPPSAPQREMATSDSFMDDEAFKRLQGKRNRGREEINFLEIKGDDQLSGNQQWMTKSLTEEKNMKSFSKKKGEQPTGQQRRKHQITYLIHQAKERELELKNTWSDNKLSRRQTQAKYGF
ncbi:proline-rich protein PRCC [Rhinophrynus dorsalis]